METGTATPPLTAMENKRAVESGTIPALRCPPRLQEEREDTGDLSFEERVELEHLYEHVEKIRRVPWLQQRRDLESSGVFYDDEVGLGFATGVLMAKPGKASDDCFEARDELRI